MNKDKEKDPAKLKAEELEKRAAPMSLTYTDPTSDPTTSTDPTTTTDTTTGHKQGQTGGQGGGKLVQ